MHLHSNHPLAHLMQSVFGMHDLGMFNVYVYATSASDDSSNRLKIERESQHFLNCSSWPTKAIVERIVSDHIHIRTCSMI
jgi:protein O-GlcNAc transferase